MPVDSIEYLTVTVPVPLSSLLQTPTCHRIHVYTYISIKKEGDKKRRRKRSCKTSCLFASLSKTIIPASDGEKRILSFFFVTFHPSFPRRASTSLLRASRSASIASPCPGTAPSEAPLLPSMLVLADGLLSLTLLLLLPRLRAGGGGGGGSMLSRFLVSPEVRREVGSALCALGGRRTDAFRAGGGGGAAESLVWLGGSGGRL